MTDWEQQLVLLAVSLAANIFSAFSGGGAGLVQFPVLIFLGLPFGMALATHKVASVALGVGATSRHWREESLQAGAGDSYPRFWLTGRDIGCLRYSRCTGSRSEEHTSELQSH